MAYYAPSVGGTNMITNIKCLTPGSIPKLKELLSLVSGLGFKIVGNPHQSAEATSRVVVRLSYGNATTPYLTVWGFDMSANIFSRHNTLLVAFEFEDDRWTTTYCVPSRWPQQLSD